MLEVALKEWAVVCDLLLEGTQRVLLRKGGIAETGGAGVFELEHDRFALFPSWAHQKPEMIKPRFRGRVETLDEPAELTLHGVGQVAKAWPVPGRAGLEKLDDLHGWSAALIDMRFEYKPDRPLYLVAVRCWRLKQPKTIAYHAAYGGCRSWVGLRPGHAVDDDAVEPVVDDAAFEQTLDRIEAAMGASPSDER